MSYQKHWSNINYVNLPKTFYNRGILSPCKRFYISVRSEGSRPTALNWGILDLYTEEYKDGFRFRRDAVKYYKELVA